MNHGFDLNPSKHLKKREYYGKYRAFVTRTNDPLKMGRIKVKCPKVLGDYESDWCLPCLPPGYTTLPGKGSLVWIEFEDGNTDKPVWTGVMYKEKTFPG